METFLDDPIVDRVVVTVAGLMEFEFSLVGVIFLGLVVGLTALEFALMFTVFVGLVFMEDDGAIAFEVGLTLALFVGAALVKDLVVAFDLLAS